jgi:hypothetical protein
VTELLTVCLSLSAFLIAATIALLTVPAIPAELVLWRFLRIQALRRWITKKRNVRQPLEAKRTVQLAQKNLLWHLILTLVFFSLFARALGSESTWWRPVTTVLIIPCLAYFAGSMVQRQKIVIIQLRKRLTHGEQR